MKSCRLAERREDLTLTSPRARRRSRASPPPPPTAASSWSSDFEPKGDQPRAIERAGRRACERGDKHQVLLGVTGSGKTFTIASVLAQRQPARRWSWPTTRPWPPSSTRSSRPSSRRTRSSTSSPTTTTTSPRPTSRSRTPTSTRKRRSTTRSTACGCRATRSLFERRDVVIVASVSCIYGLGSPEAYYGMLLFVRQGDTLDRRELLAKLVEARYDRNDYELKRGTFRVRGDVIEIVPAYEESGHPHRAVRRRGGADQRPSTRSPARRSARLAQVAIYPSSHYVTPAAAAAGRASRRSRRS